MSEPTDANALLRIGINMLMARGVGADDLRTYAGVDLKDLSAPRAALSGQTPFWQAAAELLGDEHVGLHMVPHLPAFNGLVLEYFFLSSDTFGQGLRYAMHYAHALSDSLEGSLTIQQRHARLTLKDARQSPRHFLELLAGGLIRLFRSVTDGRFAPIEVSFRHTAGAAAEDYLRIYGCPVRLGADHHSLLFAAEVLDCPSRYPAPKLLQAHEALARRELAQLKKLDFVRDVRQLIGELVQEGATLAQVADRLQMPTRRLRERLSDAGTCFSDILDSCRCRLAKHLLAQTDESIDAIIQRTGFSEPSPFYRAFQRWTGQTPVEYRKQQRSNRPR